MINNLKAMTTIMINKQKRFRYSVILENGKELMKFYTLKVARAFANDEDGIIMNREISRLRSAS